MSSFVDTEITRLFRWATASHVCVCVKHAGIKSGQINKVCVRACVWRGRDETGKKMKGTESQSPPCSWLTASSGSRFFFSYIVSLNIFVFEQLNKVFLLNVKLLGNVFCALAFGLPCAPRLYPGLVSPPVPASRELGFPWERNGTSCWDGDAFDIYVLRTFIQGCSPSNFRLKIQRGTS